MNRVECQQLAEERLLAAQTLLTAGLWPSAYYLAGYAVECGLKACIFVRIATEGVIFDDKKFLDKCWTHDLEDLITHAGLQGPLNHDMSANPLLGQHWLTTTSWDEQSRYQLKTQAEAQKLYEAIADATNGVLPWIRIRW